MTAADPLLGQVRSITGRQRITLLGGWRREDIRRREHRFAAQLADTGCANSTAPSQPADGLIPYEPNAPFFSDNAIKTRWLALPDGQRIEVDSASSHFNFPVGSVLVKNFALGARLVETRLFMRHNDGNWAGYTYEWNDTGTANE